MTRLWEDTVVTALRDAQWLRCARGRSPATAFPPGFVKLDGNAESAVGDVVYASGERYFVFEVKARRSDIRDEWIGRDDGGPKLAYRSLAHFWNRLEDLSSTDKKVDPAERFGLLRFFELSLAGHHFAYWDDWEDDDGKLVGEIVVEPYVAACSALFERRHRKPSWKYLRPWPGNYFGFTWNEGANRLTSEVVSLDDALDSEVNICFSEDGCSPGRKVGLTLKELQFYVNNLIGEDEEEEGIFAVVMSDTGSFYRIAGSTRQLAMIMKPSSQRMSPRRQRKPVLTLPGARIPTP
ncbi:hypothetical protein VDQ87_06680 [Xanthomonas campestris pv. campestris]|uniref:hypothetical protein n=1 Tax=Xanthomonas campestris TaxID=339 RepID=UPI002AD48027|nr:hypothetical protein [Xanthomonas campestris]MEA0806201.1 hypothetical protein [Xanthomonas campestris pv. campestris]MEB1207229.1 hypothetical protein [Xanthomonas campestris pv. campestris]MEB1288760.1 hypothetical protein [Xanthomonas campestris pv. campestris]MEB1365416.1 hypothetical protein [Xanthomonas campestris pv. campestris]MEB1377678.1 hypothetical protein [Xanthomonas campestris pv. campestris]